MIHWREIRGELSVPISMDMFRSSGINIPVRVAKPWKLTSDQKREVTINNMVVINFTESYVWYTIERLLSSKKFGVLNNEELAKLFFKFFADLIPQKFLICSPEIWSKLEIFGFSENDDGELVFNRPITIEPIDEGEF